MWFMPALSLCRVLCRQHCWVPWHGEELRLGANGSDIGPVLAAMELDDQKEYGEALDTRVRGGRATLEDFGTLARVHEELARRGGGVVVSPAPTGS